MRRFISFCCLVLLTILTLSPMSVEVNAQDADPEWRYAFSSELGQLVAYNLNGDVNILIEAEDLLAQATPIMFDDDSALMSVTVNQSRMHYHLTPQHAEPIDIDLDHFWYPVIQNNRYVVLHGSSSGLNAAPNILYDAETHEVEPLQGVTNGTRQANCCGFSTDGTTLRYLSSESEESPPWSIIERNLETGEEHVFFSPDPEDRGDSFVIHTDRNGERWYWAQYTRNNSTRTANLLHGDGTNEVLDNDQESSSYYTLASDYFVERPKECDSGCSMILQTSDGERVTVQTGDFLPTTITPLGEGRFLMAAGAAPLGATYWLVGSDTVPQIIGYYVSGTMYARQHISPDGRWLTLVDNHENPFTFYIWDRDMQTVAYELPIRQEGNFELFVVYYSSAGQILSIRDEEVIRQPKVLSIGFDYETGTAIAFPIVENEQRRYFELLPDGTALVSRYDREAEAVLGIWRYDPATDSLTPVLADGTWQPITPFLD